MITAIVSNIKRVHVNLSYDQCLGKYCLEICTNDGIVELILAARELQELTRQLAQLPARLAAATN